MGGVEGSPAYAPRAMGDLNSLLLCTDGSDHSAGAIRAAITLTRECGSSKLTVLRVLEFNPEFEAAGQKFVEKIEAEAREHLDLIREAAGEEDVECECIVRRTDRPDQAIVEEALKRNADIIVMGRRGRTGLKKAIMGSVTAKVIGAAPCKVLVVPKYAVMRGERILLAFDGSKYSEAAEAEVVGRRGRCSLIKHLTVLSVASSDEKLPRAQSLCDKVKDDAGRAGIAVEAVAAVGKPHEVIVAAAEQRKTDMLVLGAHGRTGIEKLFLGSVSERVIALAPCAVLVVRAR